MHCQAISKWQKNLIGNVAETKTKMNRKKKRERDKRIGMHTVESIETQFERNARNHSDTFNFLFVLCIVKQYIHPIAWIKKKRIDRNNFAYSIYRMLNDVNLILIFYFFCCLHETELDYMINHSTIEFMIGKIRNELFMQFYFNRKFPVQFYCTRQILKANI